MPTAALQMLLRNILNSGCCELFFFMASMFVSSAAQYIIYLPLRSEDRKNNRRIFDRPGWYEVFPLSLNEIKSSNTFPKLTISTLVPQFFKGHFRICFGLPMLLGYEHSKLAKGGTVGMHLCAVLFCFSKICISH